MERLLCLACRILTAFALLARDERYGTREARAIPSPQQRRPKAHTGARARTGHGHLHPPHHRHRGLCTHPPQQAAVAIRGRAARCQGVGRRAPGGCVPLGGSGIALQTPLVLEGGRAPGGCAAGAAGHGTAAQPPHTHPRTTHAHAHARTHAQTITRAAGRAKAVRMRQARHRSRCTRRIPHPHHTASSLSLALTPPRPPPVLRASLFRA